jgi:glyoxylase-like metal-dependent hydrolase (beta-lactamase superfamily II)
VLALNDAEAAHFDLPGEAIPDATAADWAAADGIDPASRTADGRWWLRFRSFAIRYADGPVTLVDAGIGPSGTDGAWGDVPGRLPEDLVAAGIAADDVTAIVLTHLHSDHIGWALPGVTPFRRARVVVQRADVDAFGEVLGGSLLAEPERLDVRDGDTSLDARVRLVATPGHTPGHQCVLVSAGDERLMITGDLFVHAVQLLDPRLAYRHDADPELARASRTEIVRGGATGSTLAPAHLGRPFLRT